MLTQPRKRARSAELQLQIPQPLIPTLLIKSLTQEQLKLAKQISIDRANRTLILELTLEELEPRLMKSTTSPQTRSMRAQQSLTTPTSPLLNQNDKMHTLFYLGEFLIVHAKAEGLFQTPSSPQRLNVIAKALPQLTSILQSSQGQLALTAADVHEVAHLFHQQTHAIIPALPLAFSPFLKGILSIHKTSEHKDGLSVSIAVGKLVRDWCVLLPTIYRGVMQFVLHVLARLVQYETEISAKRQRIQTLSKRIFGPLMILEAEGRKVKRMVELSATLFEILLLCHGIVYPVDIDHSMMYSVSAASLLNAKKATLLMSPSRANRIMAFATPSRKKVDTAASRDLFDLFTGKGGDGYVYVMDGVCLTPTIDTIVLNKDLFVKRLRVEKEDS